MVLGLGVHDALAGDQLGGGWITRLEGHFHRLHQRLADVAVDFASRRLGLRVETAPLEHAAENLHVVLGLLEIFFPLLFELLVLGAAQRGRVNLHAAQLRLQRLVQKLVDLWLVHGAPSVVYAGVRAHRRSIGARAVLRSARTVPSSRGTATRVVVCNDDNRAFGRRLPIILSVSGISTARVPVSSRPLREALRHAARLGHVAMGIVYVIVGFTALIAAFDRRLQPTGAEGALYALRASALGRAALAGIAVGLVADSVWQGVRAIFDSDGVGDGPSGIAQRIAAGITGLLHLGLAVAAMRLLLVASPPIFDATANSWLARILALGPGAWLVGVAGAVTLGVAASMLYIAVAPGMLARLNMEAAPRVDRRPDWDAFADARVEGFRRAQHRFIGTGASGKTDANAIPAEHFTLSVMFVPPGQGNAAHTHEVEEVFFVLRGKMLVFF